MRAAPVAPLSRRSHGSLHPRPLVVCLFLAAKRAVKLLYAAEKAVANAAAAAATKRESELLTDPTATAGATADVSSAANVVEYAVAPLDSISASTTSAV